MKERIFSISIIFFALVSCVGLRTKQPLKIINSYSESWTTANEKYKGTTLTVELEGNINEVDVTGLVYNKHILKPTVKKDGNKLIIRADFETGTKNVFGKFSNMDEENMVIFTHNAIKHQILIEEIKRKPTKYYPTK